MDMGTGIALASLSIGFFGAVTTAIIKLGRNNKHVSKEVCNLKHLNLEKQISAMTKKLDEIYEYVLNHK